MVDGTRRIFEVWHTSADFEQNVLCIVFFCKPQIHQLISLISASYTWVALLVTNVQYENLIEYICWHAKYFSSCTGSRLGYICRRRAIKCLHGSESLLNLSLLDQWRSWEKDACQT